MHKSLKSLAIFLILLGLAGVASSVILYVREPKQPSIHSTSGSSEKIAVDTAPSSKTLSEPSITTYSVPSDNPKYLAIPAINISNTPVLKLGLLKTGAIATPDNIYEAGWYDGSSLPGQSGAMFIYGHVSSWQANGLFYDLKKLRSGDTTIITRGDNKTYTYKVVSSKIYPYNNVDMSVVLSPVNAGQPGLNLMTCTGQVIKGTSEFNERLVVFTTLVS